MVVERKKKILKILQSSFCVRKYASHYIFVAHIGLSKGRCVRGGETKKPTWQIRKSFLEKIFKGTGLFTQTKDNAGLK